MKRSLRNLNLIALSMFYCSCTVTVPHLAKTPIPSIEGVVTDSNDDVIQGVTVGFKGINTSKVITDSKGRFTTKQTDNTQFTMLTDFYISQDLELEANAPEYENQSVQIHRGGALSGWKYDKDFIKFVLNKKVESGR